MRTRDFARLVVAAAAVAAAACARTLPDQDRRIVDATPSARVSTDILWKEYAADAKAADGRYHGRALVVSGTVTSVTKDPGHALVLFGQEAGHGIEARLLDDQAAEIGGRAEAGQRLTLKCFCEGLQSNVVLKSCVRP